MVLAALSHFCLRKAAAAVAPGQMHLEGVAVRDFKARLRVCNFMRAEGAPLGGVLVPGKTMQEGAETNRNRAKMGS